MKSKEIREIIEALEFVADAYRNKDFANVGFSLSGIENWIEITKRQKEILDMFQMTEISTSIKIPKEIEDYEDRTDGEFMIFRTAEAEYDDASLCYLIQLPEYDFINLILLIRAMRLLMLYKQLEAEEKRNEK